VFYFPGAPVTDGNCDNDSHNEKSEDRTQKLLESIAQVSDMASQQSGFVYDSASGLYYDVQTGMYYDQVPICLSICLSSVCVHACMYMCVSAC